MTNKLNPLAALADGASGLVGRIRTASSGSTIGRTQPELVLELLAQTRAKIDEIEAMAKEEIARREAIPPTPPMSETECQELARRRAELEKYQPKVVPVQEKRFGFRKAA